MPEAVRKAVDERFYLSAAKGGGTLRREIWVDRGGRAVRYNLAYINHRICAGDDGRVLSYDCAHGVHHRHCRGRVTLVRWDSFQQIEARFEKEWKRLAKEARHAKDRDTG